jgi:bifunctional enzyme CysN/CysC
VVFYPSGKRGHIRTIEAFNRTPPDSARAGEATGFTLSEQVYVRRGEVATLAGQPSPQVTSRFRASLFWLGQRPLVPGREYLLKLGTARAPMQVEAIHRVINAATLEPNQEADRVERHAVAECTLALGRAIAIDLPAGGLATSRFVVVDDYEICGGGIVREALPDRDAALRDKVQLRNYKWEASLIPVERRAERYGQRPALVLITGELEADRKSLARELESRLFEAGRSVYFLGIANVLYGVDADLDRTREHRREHLRRVAEVANLMLDAGVILLVTAAELTRQEIELFGIMVDPEQIETVWVGPHVTTDIAFDLQIPAGSTAEGASLVVDLLRRRGIIPPAS